MTQGTNISWFMNESAFGWKFSIWTSCVTELCQFQKLWFVFDEFIVVCWRVIMALLFCMLWWGTIDKSTIVRYLNWPTLTWISLSLFIFLCHYGLGSHLITSENLFYFNFYSLSSRNIYIFLNIVCSISLKVMYVIFNKD